MTDSTPHTTLIEDVREVATKYAHHHRLCDSHKGGACDCYASHKFGEHRLAFLALDLVEQYEVLQETLRQADELLATYQDREGTSGDRLAGEVEDESSPDSLREQLEARRPMTDSQRVTWQEKYRRTETERDGLKEQLQSTERDFETTCRAWGDDVRQLESLREQLESLRDVLEEIAAMPGPGVAGTGASGWLTTHERAPKRAQEALDGLSYPARRPT